MYDVKHRIIASLKNCEFAERIAVDMTKAHKEMLEHEKMMMKREMAKWVINLYPQDDDFYMPVEQIYVDEHDIGPTVKNLIDRCMKFDIRPLKYF